MSPRSNRIKLSLAQDIVYNASKARIRTPKSILFPSIIKTLTNNTERINFVNKLGLGVSYSLLMEAHTENAYHIVEKQMKSGCVIPRNCRAELFSVYIADNIDRCEETLNGYGTTHKVNNVLIQQGGHFQKEVLCNSPKRKRGRRSFKPITTEELPMYVSSKRKGPGMLSFPQNDEKDFLLADREKEIFSFFVLAKRAEAPTHALNWVLCVRTRVDVKPAITVKTY